MLPLTYQKFAFPKILSIYLSNIISHTFGLRCNTKPLLAHGLNSLDIVPIAIHICTANLSNILRNFFTDYEGFEESRIQINAGQSTKTRLKCCYPKPSVVSINHFNRMKL